MRRDGPSRCASSRLPCRSSSRDRARGAGRGRAPAGVAPLTLRQVFEGDSATFPPRSGGASPRPTSCAPPGGAARLRTDGRHRASPAPTSPWRSSGCPVEAGRATCSRRWSPVRPAGVVGPLARHPGARRRGGRRGSRSPTPSSAGPTSSSRASVPRRRVVGAGPRGRPCRPRPPRGRRGRRRRDGGSAGSTRAPAPTSCSPPSGSRRWDRSTRSWPDPGNRVEPALVGPPRQLASAGWRTVAAAVAAHGTGRPPRCRGRHRRPRRPARRRHRRPGRRRGLGPAGDRRPRRRGHAGLGAPTIRRPICSARFRCRRRCGRPCGWPASPPWASSGWRSSPWSSRSVPGCRPTSVTARPRPAAAASVALAVGFVAGRGGERAAGPVGVTAWRPRHRLRRRPGRPLARPPPLLRPPARPHDRWWIIAAVASWSSPEPAATPPSMTSAPWAGPMVAPPSDLVRVAGAAVGAALRALVEEPVRGPMLASWTWSEELFVAHLSCHGAGERP